MDDAGVDAERGVDATVDAPDLGTDQGVDTSDAPDAERDMGSERELVCDDGEDEDRDDLPDCADPDCAADAACEDVPVLDPGSLPRVQQGGMFHAGDLVESLTTGDDPVQRDVAPGALDPWTAGVLRGRVVDTSGRPLAGVRVSAYGRPELGWTKTRASGEFDMAAPAEGRVQLEVSMAGHPTVYRHVAPEAGAARWASEEIVLTRLSQVSTQVTLGQGGVATGERVEDAAGAREAHVFVPSTVSAKLELPDGSEEAVDTLTLRVTEFTVGESGGRAMPAPLPPRIGYTWAAEVSADEAIARGARHVRFDADVSVYTDNFLGAPVGLLIPFGAYEPELMMWEPDRLTAVVVGVLEVDAVTGRASLDLDGDGVEDGQDVLDDWGVTQEELVAIGGVYAAGESFWRATIDHFSPIDCNFFSRLPGDLSLPNGRGVKRPGEPRRKRRGLFGEDCTASGSVIECNTRGLREEVGVVGTEHTLWVVSDADDAGGVVEVDLLEGIENPMGRLDPTKIVGAVVTVEVAGHRIEEKRATAQMLLEPIMRLTLPAEDAWGRPLDGAYAEVQITVAFEYTREYLGLLMTQFASRGGASARNNFASSGNGAARGSLSAMSNRGANTLSLGYTRSLRTRLSDGAHVPRLDTVHTLEPDRRVVRGDGTSFEVPSREMRVSPRLSSSNCMGCFEPPLLSDPNAGTLDGQLALSPNGDVYGLGQTSLRINGDEMSAFSYEVKERDVLFHFKQDGLREILFDYDQGGFNRQLEFDHHGTWLYALRVPQSFGDPMVIERFHLGSGSHEVVYDTSMFDDDGAQTQEVIDFDVAPDGSVYLVERRVRPNSAPSRWLRRLTPSGLMEDVLVPEVDAQTILIGGRMVVVLHEAEIGPEGEIYLLVNFANENRSVVELGPGSTIQANLTAQMKDGDQLTGMKKIAVGHGGAVYGFEPGRGLYDLTEEDAIVVGGSPRAQACRAKDGADATSCRLAADPLGVDASGTFHFDATELPRAESRHRYAGQLGGVVVTDPSEPLMYRFDWAGRHLSTHDANSGAAIHEMTYGADGVLVSITNVHTDDVTTFTWSGALLTSVTGSGGEVTRVEYDARGGVEAIERLDGARDLFEVDDGLLLSHTDPGGNESTYEWSSTRELERAVHPAGMGETTLSGATVDDSYEVTLRDPLGLETVFSRSNGGRYVERTTLPTGASSVLTRAQDLSGGATMTRTDFDGTFHQWDESRVTGPNESGQTFSLSTTYPSGAIVYTDSSEEFELVGEGALDFERREIELRKRGGSGGSRTWRRVWDEATRTQTLTPPSGPADAVVHVADDLGRVASFTAGSLLPRTYTYDAAGDLTRIEHGAMSADLTHDTFGVTTTTNALGETHTVRRDALGRIEELELPEGQTWRYGYDAMGDRVSLTTPLGGAYAMEHDALGNLTSFTAPGSNVLRREYTVGRRVSRVTTPSSEVTEWEYDTSGRLESMTSPLAQTVYAYAGTFDAPATITRTPSAAGAPTHELALTYDGAEITGWTDTLDGQARQVVLERNGLRDVTAIVDDGARIELGRDAAGRITNLDGWALTRTGPLGSASAYTRGTARVDLRYDTTGRTVGRTLTVGGVVVEGWDVSHDDAGRVSGFTSFDPATTRSLDFMFGQNGALEAVADAQSTIETYGYDDDGNRTLDASGAATFDAASRRTDAGITYDADGMLSSDGTWDLVYGARGELERATRATDGRTITYDWDALGRLTRRGDGATWVRFRYLNLTQPFELSAAEWSDGTRDRYVYAIGGGLIELRRDAASYLVSSDHVGTPRVFVDASGVLTRRVERDAFGRITADSDPGFVSWVGFAGGIEDPEVGIVRFGMRDYHLAHGRWTAPDPALFDGSPRNLYAYVQNNPVTFNDPTGLFCVGGSAFAGIGGGGQVCTTLKGFSWCGELGVGVGGGLDVQPLADLAKEGGEVELSLQGNMGPLGVSVGAKVNTCGAFTPTAGVSAGFATRSLLNENSKLSKAASNKQLGRITTKAQNRTPKTRFKTGFEGKFSYKHCAQIKY